jgi:hypothetical protein
MLVVIIMFHKPNLTIYVKGGGKRGGADVKRNGGTPTCRKDDPDRGETT